MRAPFGTSWVNLSDIPTPHRWFFRGTKRKRDVEVKLFVCPGFTHTYADLEEDDDVVLDPRDGEWKRPNCELGIRGAKHERASGRRQSKRFETRLAAEKWIVKTSRKDFPKETHRLVFGIERSRWKPRVLGRPPAAPQKCSKCRLPIRDRGTNRTNDWTGGPYCDVCALRSPRYGDHAGLAWWRRVDPRTAARWKKGG